MSVSAAPLGYLELGEVIDITCKNIKNAVGHKLEPLVALLGEHARKSPPRAIWDAAFEPIFAAICKEQVPVYTLHPQSGAVLRVPPYLFIGAGEPKNLFFRPGMHELARVPPDFSGFLGQAFFVEEHEGRACAQEATAAVLEKMEDATTDESNAGEFTALADTWRREGRSRAFWPMAFGAVLLKANGDVDAAIENYAKMMVPAGEPGADLLALMRHRAEWLWIETWLRSGALQAYGIPGRRALHAERMSEVPTLDWMALHIFCDEVRYAGIYAAPAEVPHQYWWTKLHIDRLRFQDLIRVALQFPEETTTPATNKTKRHRGRPRGTGYKAADEALVIEMEKIVEEEGISIDNAAERVALKAKGGGTPKSKQRRLRDRYTTRLRQEKNPNSSPE